MRGAGVWRAALALVAILGLGVAAAGVFVVSGVYNIGADDHHTAAVTALIGELRDRSIAVRAQALEPPGLDAAHAAAGARTYGAHCVGCHLAPGLNASDLRRGLYPHPPNLAQEAPPEARRAFWVIKHGIKMSAMPAWGRTLDDAAIWDLVAFVREMPTMTPDNYERLTH